MLYGRHSIPTACGIEWSTSSVIPSSVTANKSTSHHTASNWVYFFSNNSMSCLERVSTVKSFKRTLSIRINIHMDLEKVEVWQQIVLKMIQHCTSIHMRSFCKFLYSIQWGVNSLNSNLTYLLQIILLIRIQKGYLPKDFIWNSATHFKKFVVCSSRKNDCSKDKERWRHTLFLFGINFSFYQPPHRGKVPIKYLERFPVVSHSKYAEFNIWNHFPMPSCGYFIIPIL